MSDKELGMKFDLLGRPLCSEFSLNLAGGYKDIAGKLRWTLLPLEPLTEVVKVLEYGANKYKEPGNWKKVEVERYHEALWRHWVAYNSGEKLDNETQLSHLAHLVCDGLFILWNDLQDKQETK